MCQKSVEFIRQQDVYIDVSMRFYEDGMTPGCSVAAPLLAVTH